jgi:DNA repair exonuclease SbcCD nuclease subunit
MTSPSSFKVNTKKIDYKNIFLLADLHFGVRANSLEWLQNHLNFFKNFYIPYLKKNVRGGDILFILGDWFDNRQLLDIYVMNSSIDIILELVEILPVYFITGNHDIYKKHDTDINSLRPFKTINNITIFEKPVVITNGESKILILPWVGDINMEEKYVKQNQYDYVFAHTNIAGFRYDNNRHIHKGANLTNIKGIKRLFSGHIHKRQEYQQFLYVGSPFSTKRSDIGNSKGVYYFNPTTNKIKFTENNYSPIFQKILLENILEFTLDETNKLFNNNYSDIIVADKHINLFNLTKFVDILENCKYKKIETVGERIKLDDELSEMLEGVDIKDILTLLEISIDDLQHQTEVLIRLKILNKQYYEKANKGDLN